MFAKAIKPKCAPRLSFQCNFVNTAKSASKTCIRKNNFSRLPTQITNIKPLLFGNHRFGRRFFCAQPPSNNNSQTVETVEITNKLEEAEGVLTVEDIKKDEFSSEPINLAGKEIVAVFNCGVCETRNIRAFSRMSYTKGVVIVRCGGCKKLHLMADNLGWFEDKAVNIETILMKKGQKVRKVSAEQWQDILHKQSENNQQSSSLQNSLHLETDTNHSNKS